MKNYLLKTIGVITLIGTICLTALFAFTGFAEPNNLITFHGLIKISTTLIILYVYSYGIFYSKKFIIPFAVFFALYGIYSSLIEYSSYSVDVMFISIIIMWVILNLLILYKYYRAKDQFIGNYCTYGTLIILLALGLATYADIINQPQPQEIQWAHSR